MLAAQERERTRIARELHDEVGQTLTAIALRAERAVDEPAVDARRSLTSPTRRCAVWRTSGGSVMSCGRRHLTISDW